MITGLINETILKKKSFGAEPRKFEEESEYRDVKPADQSGDNDTDRVPAASDGVRKATDEAYTKNQAGSGTGPSIGRH